MPEWAKDPIILEFPDSYFLNSFWKLHTERRFESGPIPRSEIRKHIERLKIHGQLLEDMIDVIAHVDSEFLSYLAKERKKKMDREQHQTMKKYNRK